MKESNIQYYTNSRGIYNTPHFGAWAVAIRLAHWGIYNLRYGFLPPKILGITLYPNDPNMRVEDPEQFTPEMFGPAGPFHETPLNHYIKVQPAFSKDSFLINAGYLLNHFILDNKLGYKEYKRLLNAENKGIAKTDYNNQQTKVLSAESPKEL